MKDNIEIILDYVAEKGKRYIEEKMEDLNKKRRSSVRGVLYKLILEVPDNDKKVFVNEFLSLPVEFDEIQMISGLFPKEELKVFLNLIEKDPYYNRKVIFERNALSMIFKSNESAYENKKTESLDLLLDKLYPGSK